MVTIEEILNYCLITNETAAATVSVVGKKTYRN